MYGEEWITLQCQQMKNFDPACSWITNLCYAHYLVKLGLSTHNKGKYNLVVDEVCADVRDKYFSQLRENDAKWISALSKLTFSSVGNFTLQPTDFSDQSSEVDRSMVVREVADLNRMCEGYYHFVTIIKND